MKRKVLTYNAIEGFHRYPNAPEFCAYLSARHRHIFVIRCEFEVSHNEREIEINEQQHVIEKMLTKKFGSPCEFGDMSCETIAELIMKEYKRCIKAEVKEDDYGGASLSR